MRKFLILAAVAATATFASAAPSLAQGVVIDTPVGGVRVGEPNRYRDYDRPRYREGWRERNVYVRGGNCRTVTIQRDDGSVKRIRRCD